MNEMTWADLWAARELFASPILCAGIAGAVLGFLSVFVVLKRMVFISAAVSQSAGLGVALAFLGESLLGCHLPAPLLATLTAIAATLLCAADFRRFKITKEALLGFVYAGSGSLAVILGEKMGHEAGNAEALLFGSAVLVSDEDVQLVAMVGTSILLVLIWGYRGITFAAFDEHAASSQGLPTHLLQGILLIAMGSMIGVSARALGALPTFAFSTLPAIAALRCPLSLPKVLLAATFIGAFDGIFGYLLAFQSNLPVGASQTALAVGVALFAFLLGSFFRCLATRQAAHE